MTIDQRAKTIHNKWLFNSMETKMACHYKATMDDLIKIGHKHNQVHNSITLHKLSESDSKLYTNFEFCEGKNHTHLKTY